MSEGRSKGKVHVRGGNFGRPPSNTDTFSNILFLKKDHAQLRNNFNCPRDHAGVSGGGGCGRARGPGGRACRRAARCPPTRPFGCTLCGRSLECEDRTFFVLAAACEKDARLLGHGRLFFARAQDVRGGRDQKRCEILRLVLQVGDPNCTPSTSRC